ncbi:MAG: hypothetical protein HRT61_01225 [Ekhidna sp.]|nr:hypothetical protein [Ekhidna sp.]
MRTKVTVSADAFKCNDLPLVPHVDATDNEIAEYIVGITLVAESCKNELEVELPQDLQELGVVLE